MAVITIWQPRYHDRVVLIAKYRVQDNNIIKFIKDGNWNGSYPLTRKQITKYPLESNGRIPCYAVSLDELVDAD